MRIINIINKIRSDATENEPTEIEQDIAYHHACIRDLERPDTSYLTFSIKLMLLLFSGIVFGLIFYNCLLHFKLFSFLPKTLYNFYKAKSLSFCFGFVLITEVIIMTLFSKRIIIGAIKLYQKYADEEIRRRCLFKPTCSEYTIMALNKYGVFLGLYLSYKRVFKKCRGNTYRIDYP